MKTLISLMHVKMHVRCTLEITLVLIIDQVEARFKKYLEQIATKKLHLKLRKIVNWEC